MTKKLILLGATGSIGRQTVECVEEANRRRPGSFELTGLSVNTDLGGLLELSKRFPRALLAMGSTSFSDTEFLPSQAAIGTKARSETSSQPGLAGSLQFTGSGAVDRLLEGCEADLVVNGIAGSPGLKASYLALKKGMDLALANKESVVMGYSLLASLAEKNNLSIIPVDSEHAALFQLVNRCGAQSIQELCITASGGPFRDKSKEELMAISPDQAASHPVWKMGRKISIDSATLANKGLELIEAVRLFGFQEQRVRVLIHPQSLVHAIVRTVDGSLYANLSSPDMRLPIDIALNWPNEVESSFGKLDLAGKTLSFFEPDLFRFPMLRLAREAIRQGEAGTIAYNASNEVAVEAFVEGRIRFTDIATVVEESLSADWSLPAGDLGSIFYHDARAREKARAFIAEIKC
jgi:1-deoxy-D-xylulose 5-phosphate reductoisomerase